MIRHLDVNVVLALLDPENAKHGATKEWFDDKRNTGWGTSFMVQASAVRILSILPSQTRSLSPTDALRIVRDFVDRSDHTSIQIPPTLKSVVSPSIDFIRGHKQLSDTIFLRLAQKNNALFSTFDQGIRVWLPKNHQLHDHLETLEL